VEEIPLLLLLVEKIPRETALFQRIIGHGDVLSLLEKALSSRDLEGVYLFHGPRSVGKHTAAREFAKMAVCSGTMDDGCACVNCKLFPDIPDYKEIGGVSKVIKAEDARSVSSFLSLAPYSGPRRAVVVDDADTMNKQSAYSMLKTLEECRGAVIIMVSSDDGRINSAIKSRATPLRFGQLSPEEVSQVLVKQGHSRENLADVCRAMPFFSKSILQDYSKYAYYLEHMPGMLKRLSSGAVDDVISAAMSADEAGEAVHFAEAMLSSLSDVLKAHYDSPAQMACLSKYSELESLTVPWSDDVCIASSARLSDVLDAARSPLNLKTGPRLFAAVGWMAAYVSQSMVLRGIK